MDLTPTTLNGRLIRLEPLNEAHVPGLSAVGLNDKIWGLMVYGNMHTEADMRNWVLDLLGRQARGTDLPYVVVIRETGQVVGATRFMNIVHEHRNLEIGGTWYAPEFQGTPVNPEAKFLLLQRAFEGLGVIRAQLKTDLRNERSQRAIEKLGAAREGVLRQHMILPDGHVRDSVIYSVIDKEWPAVKKKLIDRLGYDPSQG